MTSHRMSARDSGSKSRFVHPLKGSFPQPTFTLSGGVAEWLSHAFAFAHLFSLARFVLNAFARRPTPIRIRRGLKYL